MKNLKTYLYEGVFDIDNNINRNPWTVLDEWMNSDVGYVHVVDKYIAVMKYLMSYNSKLPDVYDWQFDENKFPKNLKEFLKELKKEYSKYITKSIWPILWFDSYKVGDVDVYDDVDLTPFDDIATDIMTEMYRSNDGVARYNKLPNKWYDAFYKYNEYFGLGAPMKNCVGYVCIADDDCIFVLGLPKGLPKDILNLFNM